MDEKLDNFRVPDAEGQVAEAFADPHKTFASAEDCYADLSTQESKPVFKSRFKGWLRTVALTVVLVFVPEQASWAFNYNPQVLWGQKEGQVLSVSQDATPEEIASAQIAASVSHLLDQVAYKENTRIKLELNNDAIRDPDLKTRDLLIDSNSLITKSRIKQIENWLRKPEIHPLNCGVYALKDLLKKHNIETTLEELSVSSLMVDFMNDIIRPGDPKLKTSLFAINKLTDAYGLDLQSAKLNPVDILKLQPPFIANLEPEHFVTVTNIDADRVFYEDIGNTKSATFAEFVAKSTGFVLAPGLEEANDIVFENVPDSVKAFVWGSSWVRREEALPGQMGSDSIWTIIITTTITMILTGPMGVAFGDFFGTLKDIAILEFGMDAFLAMLVFTALQVLLTGDFSEASAWDVIQTVIVKTGEAALTYYVLQWMDDWFDDTILGDLVTTILASIIVQSLMIGVGAGLTALGEGLGIGDLDLFDIDEIMMGVEEKEKARRPEDNGSNRRGDEFAGAEDGDGDTSTAIEDGKDLSETDAGEGKPVSKEDWAGYYTTKYTKAEVGAEGMFGPVFTSKLGGFFGGLTGILLAPLRIIGNVMADMNWGAQLVKISFQYTATLIARIFDKEIGDTLSEAIGNMGVALLSIKGIFGTGEGGVVGKLDGLFKNGVWKAMGQLEQLWDKTKKLAQNIIHGNAKKKVEARIGEKQTEIQKQMVAGINLAQAIAAAATRGRLLKPYEMGQDAATDAKINAQARAEAIKFVRAENEGLWAKAFGKSAADVAAQKAADSVGEGDGDTGAVDDVVNGDGTGEEFDLVAVDILEAYYDANKASIEGTREDFIKNNSSKDALADFMSSDDTDEEGLKDAKQVAADSKEKRKKAADARAKVAELMADEKFSEAFLTDDGSLRADKLNEFFFLLAGGEGDRNLSRTEFEQLPSTIAAGQAAADAAGINDDADKAREEAVDAKWSEYKKSQKAGVALLKEYFAAVYATTGVGRDRVLKTDLMESDLAGESAVGSEDSRGKRVSMADMMERVFDLRLEEGEEYGEVEGLFATAMVADEKAYYQGLSDRDKELYKSGKKNGSAVQEVIQAALDQAGEDRVDASGLDADVLAEIDALVFGDGTDENPGLLAGMQGDVDAEIAKLREEFESRPEVQAIGEEAESEEGALPGAGKDAIEAAWQKHTETDEQYLSDVKDIHLAALTSATQQAFEQLKGGVSYEQLSDDLKAKVDQLAAMMTAGTPVAYDHELIRDEATKLVVEGMSGVGASPLTKEQYQASLNKRAELELAYADSNLSASEKADAIEKGVNAYLSTFVTRAGLQSSDQQAFFDTEIKSRIADKLQLRIEGLANIAVESDEFDLLVQAADAGLGFLLANDGEALTALKDAGFDIGAIPDPPEADTDAAAGIESLDAQITQAGKELAALEGKTGDDVESQRVALESKIKSLIGYRNALTESNPIDAFDASIAGAEAAIKDRQDALQQMDNMETMGADADPEKREKIEEEIYRLSKSIVQLKAGRTTAQMNVQMEDLQAMVDAETDPDTKIKMQAALDELKNGQLNASIDILEGELKIGFAALYVGGAEDMAEFMDLDQKASKGKSDMWNAILKVLVVDGLTMGLVAAGMDKIDENNGLSGAGNPRMTSEARKLKLLGLRVLGYTISNVVDYALSKIDGKKDIHGGEPETEADIIAAKETDAEVKAELARMHEAGEIDLTDETFSGQLRIEAEYMSLYASKIGKNKDAILEGMADGEFDKLNDQYATDLAAWKRAGRRGTRGSMAGRGPKPIKPTFEMAYENVAGKMMETKDSLLARIGTFLMPEINADTSLVAMIGLTPRKVLLYEKQLEAVEKKMTAANEVACKRGSESCMSGSGLASAIKAKQEKITLDFANSNKQMSLWGMDALIGGYTSAMIDPQRSPLIKAWGRAVNMMPGGAKNALMAVGFDARYYAVVEAGTNEGDELVFAYTYVDTEKETVEGKEKEKRTARNATFKVVDGKLVFDADVPEPDKETQERAVKAYKDFKKKQEKKGILLDVAVGIDSRSGERRIMGDLVGLRGSDVNGYGVFYENADGWTIDTTRLTDEQRVSLGMYANLVRKDDITGNSMQLFAPIGSDSVTSPIQASMEAQEFAKLQETEARRIQKEEGETDAKVAWEEAGENLRKGKGKAP